MQTTKIIETKSVTREYGFKGLQAIVDHPHHGRLLLIDGFGGQDSLEGGAVRWRHGLAAKLLSDDTFESLHEPHYGWVNELDVVLDGSDPKRPLLEWDGSAIEAIAHSAGL